MDKREKLEELKRILKKSGQCMIAFSGGVDSSFLLKTAVDTLGGRVTAVTAQSPIYFQKELKEAEAFARTLGVDHRIIQNSALSDPAFRENPPERCYLCKKRLFETVRRLAEKEQASCIMDATNTDDFSDFRPGLKAVKECGVTSPLAEAGLSKREIRDLAREMGLDFWDKPAMACLASRIPYGDAITEEALEKIEKAELFLQELGFTQVRVRCHESLARIEAPPGRIPELTGHSMRAEIVETFRELGFHYTAVDLEGYRTGSLNELLPEK